MNKKYESYTVRELRDIAKEQGIHCYCKLRKSETIVS